MSRGIIYSNVMHRGSSNHMLVAAKNEICLFNTRILPKCKQKTYYSPPIMHPCHSLQKRCSQYIKGKSITCSKLHPRMCDSYLSEVTIGVLSFRYFIANAAWHNGGMVACCTYDTDAIIVVEGCCCMVVSCTYGTVTVIAFRDCCCICNTIH